MTKFAKKAILGGLIAAVVLSASFWGYELLLWAMHGFNVDYSSIDRCLDSGGKWNYNTRQCEQDLPAIPDSVTDCVIAINEILRPDGKYLMGAGIRGDSCIAKIAFSTREDLEAYETKRETSGKKLDSEIVRMEDGTRRTVWMELSIEEIRKP